MANHGVFVTERNTSLSTPVVASSGIPFVVGCAPIHTADNPAGVQEPTLITNWNEFLDKFGYCEDWANFTLCEFAYSQFVLYNMQPVIFLNLFDPATMKAAQTAADFNVTDHKINLGKLAINDSALVVKDKDETPNTLTKDTDYVVYFANGEMIIELLSTGSYYSETALNIVYDKAVFTSITASAVATALDKIELCMTKLGVLPSFICAPGWSDQSSVAAAMATKAGAINGMFRAKALIDVPCGSGAATTYSSVATAKAANNMTDPNQILCWPLLKLGDKTFHMSTQLAGLMAAIDAEVGAPHYSPSNHPLRADKLVIADGTEVLLSKAQADTVNNAGVITALNFMGSFVIWGHYTACYPGNTDIKDYYVPVSRVFDWVGNTLIQTFWSQLDKPMTRRLVDTILDSANVWINGLIGSGYILGGRVEMIESENSLTNLLAGIVNLHVYLTPPSPAQEIDFTLEYDASYLQAAFEA